MRKGTNHSPETKAKIATTKSGKLFTAEHSKAISDALKGKKKTVKHIEAISAGIKAAQLKRAEVENNEKPETLG